MNVGTDNSGFGQSGTLNSGWGNSGTNSSGTITPAPTSPGSSNSTAPDAQLDNLVRRVVGGRR
ncbi:hypothetical protein [Mycobacterium ostraviense]|uniref:hypothetical protein n=1 Tax=Mycobacterium ostraviense TaxID=2738409 RepID=UPI003B8A70A0